MHKLLLIATLLVALLSAESQPIAFPGAEGYGRFTKGGRGGKVYEVINLNDSGTGSLRAAINASGARTVVFRISGTISLNSPLNISHPNITIAGQTAPGDGICIKNYPININTDQVIIRYIRVRLGSDSQTESDALSSRYHKNIIIDHVTTSWSVDETMSVYNGDSTTIQWCLVSESLYKSNHVKGNHGYGAIWGGNHYTYHHNLLAHHSSRNPRFSSGCGYTDYVNNVVYNWGFMSSYGAEQKDQSNSAKFSFAEINMRNNYYKPGPATDNFIFARPSTRDGLNDLGKWYVEGNYFYGNETYNQNNWIGITPDDGISYTEVQPDEPFDPMPINMQTAEEAYSSVLSNVGATLPKRDTVDRRIIHETRNQYATYVSKTYKPNVQCGIIDSQDDVGGWPELNSTPAPTDSDQDGMPDEWEDANGLIKTDASDRNTMGSDGYTMLEKYLNSIEFNQKVTGKNYEFVSNSSIKISWNDTYLAEDGFIIMKSSDGNTYEPIDTVSSNVSFYIDPSVADLNNLFYNIVAFKGDMKTPLATEYIKITGFDLQFPDIVYERDTIKPILTIAPENATNGIVEFSLRPEDEDVVDMLSDGTIITKKMGDIKVTVKSIDGSGISETFSLNIKDIIEITTINILIDDTILVDKRAYPDVEITPEDATFPSLVYSIRKEDEEFALLSSTTGSIKGIKPGTIEFTASSTDGSGIYGTKKIVILDEASSVRKSHTSGSKIAFEVYPNPFYNRIQIKLLEIPSANANLKIINNAGVQVLEIKPTSQDLEVNTQILTEGIYMVLFQNNGEVTKRIICKN